MGERRCRVGRVAGARAHGLSPSGWSPGRLTAVSRRSTTEAVLRLGLDHVAGQIGIGLTQLQELFARSCLDHRARAPVDRLIDETAGGLVVLDDQPKVGWIGAGWFRGFDRRGGGVAAPALGVPMPGSAMAPAVLTIWVMSLPSARKTAGPSGPPPHALELPEETQEHRARLVGDRQRLDAKLLLGLQGGQLSAFLAEVWR